MCKMFETMATHAKPTTNGKPAKVTYDKAAFEKMAAPAPKVDKAA
ncbi:MAG: hypothetical protein RIM84_23165 [Alphaproteobacteria bacterium]